MTASLCACGEPSPTDVVDEFMTAVKTQDTDATAATYAGDDLNFLDDMDLQEAGDGEEATAMDKVVEEKMLPKMMEFEYTLGEEVIDGDKATVDVTIKTYNFGSAFSSFMTNYLTQAFAMAFSGGTEEEMDNLGATLLSTEMDNLTEMTCEKTATVSLTHTDEGWVIDALDEEGPFYDALTGGLVTTISTLDESF